MFRLFSVRNDVWRSTWMTTVLITIPGGDGDVMRLGWAVVEAMVR